MKKIIANWPIVIVLSMAGSWGLIAGDWPTGNLDEKGSRAIKEGEEPGFTKNMLSLKGLEKKWSFPSSDPKVDPTTVGNMVNPVVKNDIVYVGDSNGYLYAIDRDGKMKWRTCTEIFKGNPCASGGSFPARGVLASPTIDGNYIYVGTLEGVMFKIKRNNGAITWDTRQLLEKYPAYSMQHDIWNSPMVAGKKVVFVLNLAGDVSPNRVPFKGPSVVVAVNEQNGSEEWMFTTLTDSQVNSGASGVGAFSNSFSYSKKLDLLFVTTGQINDPSSTGSIDTESAFIALHVNGPLAGTLAWTPTQTFPLASGGMADDIWNGSLAYDLFSPIDIDVGDGAALFKMKDREYLAAGSKLGIFYILDAATGTIVNGNGAGLNAFGPLGIYGPAGDGSGDDSGYPGYPLNFPTTSILGGFQLDSGYFRFDRDENSEGNREEDEDDEHDDNTNYAGKNDHLNSEKGLRHFATLLDYRAINEARIASGQYPGFCYHANAGKGAQTCAESGDETGIIMVIDGNGENTHCTYEHLNGPLWQPFYVNGMIISVSGGITGGPAQNARSGNLHVIDADTCNEVVPPFSMFSGRLYGSSVVLSNGRIYSTNGYLSLDNPPNEKLVSVGVVGSN